MDKVHVGFVGCGWFGNFHLDYLLTREDVDVVAFATGNEEKLRKTGKKASGARLYSEAMQLIEQEEKLDALFICVPPDRHDGIERAAAERGVHLYVEKPVGNSLDEVMKTAIALAKSDIVCAVGYQGRYDNGIQEMRTLSIQSPPYALQGHWVNEIPSSEWWRDKARSGGQVVEQSTHLVDLMRYFAGEAVAVYGTAQNNILPHDDARSVDDVSFATIWFQNGALGSLVSGCFQDPALAMPSVSLRAHARDYTFTYDWFGGIKFVSRESERNYSHSGENHARAAAAFITAVKGGDKEAVRCGYIDAMRTFILTLAIEQAITSGQKVLVPELLL